MRSAVRPTAGRIRAVAVALDPADDLPSGRAEVLRSVRERVRAGRYHPADDAVAEVLVAWLFADEAPPTLHAS